MCSLVLHWEPLITALSVVCFGWSNLCRSTMSEVLSFWSIVPTGTMSTVQSGALHVTQFWSQLIYFDSFDRAIGEVIGRLVATTVLRSRSGDKKWFDAGCQRSHDKQHAVQIIGINLCSLMLRPRGSVVLQGSHIMNEQYSEALYLFRQAVGDT